MSTTDLSRLKPRQDRFIPLRAGAPQPDPKALIHPAQTTKKSRILSFAPANNTSSNENENPTPDLTFKKSRDNSTVVSGGETQILRAEGFRNDYYNHLLDCKDENVLVAVLDNTPFLFNRKQRQVTALSAGSSQSEETLTSVAFSPLSPLLALGSEFGLIRLLSPDSSRGEILDVHSSRIGCLAWNPRSPTLLASGSKDKLIRFRDIRTSSRSVFRFAGHTGEICGLTWNSNGISLASGGNDNLVNVWDLRMPREPKLSIAEHRAAVRGLCWAPFRENLLASGGGSGDMRLLVHNTDKGKVVKEILTDSQICAIAWDEQSKALVTGHGFSRYQICVWDFEAERFVYEFLGHNNRVLSLVPAGQNGTLVSGSSDETIRVWDVRKILRQWEQKSTVLTPVKIR